jgi:hypothetical protein
MTPDPSRAAYFTSSSWSVWTAQSTKEGIDTPYE